jgi:trk system potassium uptake protein TrkH
MLHPRAVTRVKFEGKQVEDHTLSSIATYFAVYVISIALIFLLLSLEPYDLETNFSAAVSCFNNIGPGLAAVGPMGSYAAYSPLAKILLTFAMLMGRLEIFPMLIAMNPSTWKKR